MATCESESHTASCDDLSQFFFADSAHRVRSNQSALAFGVRNSVVINVIVAAELLMSCSSSSVVLSRGEVPP